ncbi:MAG: Gfo/Idh/MocA family oxidoreductase [Eubacteriales bacterium]|nr:Gfo/Idh/MocA family oxidoreductase [Eubacteriales bacterium]
MKDCNFAHTPYEKMFDRADVYGVAFDEERQKKRPVRLCIIGTGGVAVSKHIPAIARLRSIWEPVELSAICNRSERFGKNAASVCGAHWYSDVSEMLAHEQLDGAIITSPDSLHAAHAVQCLENGLHVLVEKPLANSLAEGLSICETARRTGRICMTVSNKRFSPPYYRAKKLIEDGRIKDPSMFVTKFNLGYNYVNILEGGTVHVLDLMRYFMGDVRSLSAAGVKKYDFNKTGYPFDSAVALAEFESGAVGTVYTSSTALSLKPWEVVEIYGEKSWLKVDDQYSLTLYDDETGPEKTWKPIVPNTLFFDEEFGGFMGLIENFCNAIRGLEAPLVTGHDGYKALELVYAFHLAVADGEKISLPLEIEYADRRINQILRK